MKYLFALCIIYVVFFLYGGFDILTNQYDDSYITYRYAVNLAEGKGLVFNAGERIDAASSFLYTVILAGFYKVGIKNLEIVSIVLSLASLFVIALLIIKTIEGEK